MAAKPSPEAGARPSRKSRCSAKLSVYLLAIFAMLFILFHIEVLRTPESSSWDFISTNYKNLRTVFLDCTSKLQESVTFLPLKDLRYSSNPLQTHTWFMSSMMDTHENGEPQYLEFPSAASKDRVLCLKGKDIHDGSLNSYALAWPDALPPNATLFTGLTFVSYNHYNYDNLWHSLSSVVPFVAWHIKNQCSSLPTRWILYHWGELRTTMGPWITSLVNATFGELNIEKFEGFDDGDGKMSSPVCFEKAVVMRHAEAGMSGDKRLPVYDLVRCRARASCNVSSEGRLSDVDEKGIPVIRMTMLMRAGPRSFKNESVVIEIFDRACRKAEGCRLTVAYASNLTFCEQVKLMSSTDILVSPHGGQLTNMFLMDRNSSVMEFFPKGWLKLAGIGQYVYHWMAKWAGMKHCGAWRDTGGDPCPYPEEDSRCMAIYKNAKIGYNETYFSEWAANVLSDVKLRKAQEISNKTSVGVPVPVSTSCAC
ncbi:UNVERIFIED_CONTAM: hypothetical protein Scaly_1390300 [Sesamum calycinum]|uniref:Glycosyltransferase 61 catalytic domain-containing protein n=2 Tax=Sesamum TaxID=4181 RepID=A0AAW2PNB0_9LAMI